MKFERFLGSQSAGAPFPIRRPRPRLLVGAGLLVLAGASAALAATGTLAIVNATGAALSSPQLMTGALSVGNPDTETTSPLSPTLRAEVDYDNQRPDPVTPTVNFWGPTSFTGPTGHTLPVTAFQWDGLATSDNRTLFANGARTSVGSLLTASEAVLGTTDDRRNQTYWLNHQLKLVNSWLYAHGTYTGTLNYRLYEGGSGLTARTQLIRLDIPAKLSLSVPTSILTLTADPADPDPTSTTVTAQVKANARTADTTSLTLSATPLMYGANVIPTSAFTFSTNGTGSTAVAATPVTVSSFSGPSAGRNVDLNYTIAGSWGYAPTPTGSYYTSTVTYAAAVSGSTTLSQSLTPTTVQVAVPPRIVLSVNSGAVNIFADPSDSGTENVASRAAIVTVKSNYGNTTLYVTATQPTSGADTLPMAGFKYRVNTVPAPVGGTSTIGTLGLLTGNGVWSVFPTSQTAIATVTGRTDGAVFGYDYTYDRSWSLKSGAYTSTVTYTVAGS